MLALGVPFELERKQHLRHEPLLVGCLEPRQTRRFLVNADEMAGDSNLNPEKGRAGEDFGVRQRARFRPGAAVLFKRR